jgi:NAD-dependent deacetylase
MCQTTRCCLDHCCDWDSCQCGDCEFCGGTKPTDLTTEEIAKNLEIKEQEKNKELEEKSNDNLNTDNAPEIQPEAVAEPKIDPAIAREERNQEIQKLLEHKFSSAEDQLKHEQVKQMIEDTKKTTAETISKIDRTMDTIRKTLDTCQATSAKYEQFKRGVEGVLEMSLQGMVDGAIGGKKMVGFGNYMPDEDDFGTYLPEISDIDSVADLILTKTNIVVVTAPDVASETGLPTLKCDNGYWTLKNKGEKMKAEDFLTQKFFKEQPGEVWRWHHQFKKTVFHSEPNLAHLALADMQSFSKEANINFALITQNIDSFHVEAHVQAEAKNQKNYFEEEKGVAIVTNEDAKDYGFCEDVYEINGNINYMRCGQDCTQKLFPSPMIGCPEDVIPTCPKCKGVARPHTLFYDEEPTEHFHKVDTIKNRVSSVDCLILVGKLIDNNIMSNLISHAVTSNSLIVEITQQPCIEIGNVKQLIGFSHEIVPELCSTIHKKMQSFAAGSTVN